LRELAEATFLLVAAGELTVYSFPSGPSHFQYGRR